MADPAHPPGRGERDIPLGGGRFSAWDGSQTALGVDADEVFDRLSEEVFHGWDFETAMRRLMSQGMRGQSGRRQMGLEQMMEQLRRRRQQQLQRFNLDNVFKDIQEKLDAVLRQERRGIEERIAGAADETAQRVLERVARSRRETLDSLPAEPGGAIKQLRDYEFMDQKAQQAFDALLEELKKGVVDTYFQQMSQTMQNVSKQDVSKLREMLKDLNSLMASAMSQAPEEQVQREYDRFKAKWGRMFPDAPDTFPEFMEQLRRQMAQMDSLMQSLSPEMRRQLEELMDSAFGDPELQAQLQDLAAALGLLSPGGELGQQYAFMGGESLPLDEAMNLMGTLQTSEELEAALREVYRGGELNDDVRAQVRELLGEDAARSLEAMGEMSRQLEQRGLIQRGDRGMELTARGMRRIGQKALGDLFDRLKRDRFGNHALPREGQGGERSDQTKLYEFGDAFDLDVQGTLMNALRRETSEAGEQPRRAGSPRLVADDFAVHRNESLTRSSTVLMLDMSRSMPLRGYFYAAKKVAMALDALIRSQYPRDQLHIVGFSDYARVITSSALPQLSVNEYVYGTNLQHGLILARRLLGRDRTANRQIIVISDGEPTAHMEGSHAVFFYPPLPETFQKTLLEVQRCTRDGITINTFMLESNHRLVQFVNAMSKLNGGRTFFISPDRLGDYVLVDYAKRRGSAA
ncbi:MAG: VWA domain-containing protein [Candidatus Dormibacteria bacterium]